MEGRGRMTSDDRADNLIRGQGQTPMLEMTILDISGRMQNERTPRTREPIVEAIVDVIPEEP
jgi:hypothetical protein